MAHRLRVVRTVPALRAAVRQWRKRGERIALVPTMGALHAGHLALVRAARRRARRLVVSIFVNPAQFAPHEDFASYPRTFDTDLAALAELAVDLVWAPPVAVMYPAGFATRIVPEGPAKVGLEDKFRPHFFGGVTTVVGKLLIQCEPDFAMFGEKDYQQLKVVTRLANDLDLPLKIVGVADGARAGRPRPVLAQRLSVGDRARGSARAPSRARGLRRQDHARRAARPRARRRRRGDRARRLHARLSRSPQCRHARAGRVGQGRPAPPAGRRPDRQDAADRQYRGGQELRAANTLASRQRIYSKPSSRNSRRSPSGMFRAPGAARSRSRGASFASR